MTSRLLAAATAIAIGALIAGPAAAQQKSTLFPEIVDASHATPKAAAFFKSFFTAKSKHSVDATMSHFSEKKVTYIDATLGWPFYDHKSLKGVFAAYMPKWPASGLSYPTRILGNESSALVAFTDTPELFGSEIRILAAIDLKDGKVIRWIDYWDGRHFGAKLAAKMRTPAAKFPKDFQEKSAEGNASAKIREVAAKLNAAFAAKDAKAAAALFSYDAVYEDMTLRAQVLGQMAIERYLVRALASLPYGDGAAVLHVVGGDKGGGYEWRAGPKYQANVGRGITALALDGDGKIVRLTAVWDGAVVPDAEVKAMVLLSLE